AFGPGLAGDGGDAEHVGGAGAPFGEERQCRVREVGHGAVDVVGEVGGQFDVVLQEEVVGGVGVGGGPGSAGGAQGGGRRVGFGVDNDGAVGSVRGGYSGGAGVAAGVGHDGRG